MSFNGTGTLTEAYVSTLTIHEPSVDSVLTHVYLPEDSLTDFMKIMGKTKKVQQSTHRHFEKVRPQAAITLSSTTSAPGAGVAVTVTLDSTSHKNSGTESFGQVGDLVYILKARVQAQVTAVNKGTANAHTYTIKPVRAADNIGALAPGDKMTVFSNAWGEGTAQPEGRKPDVTYYDFNLQLVKATYAATGTEYTNRTYVDFTDENGKKGRYFTLLGAAETESLLKAQQEYNVVFGQKADNLGMRTAEGLLAFIENRGGNVETYNTGGWTYADWQTITKKLAKSRIPVKEFIVKQGVEFYQENQTWIQDVHKAGGIQYAAFGGKKEVGIAMDYDSIIDNGYSFHLSNYSTFNDAETFGATGSQFPGSAVFLPHGNAPHPETGAPTPYMRLLEKDGNGYDRGLKVWRTGVWPDMATSQTDKMEVNYLMEYAPEFFAPQHFFYVKRLS